MTEREAELLEKYHPDIMVMDSSAKGLKYLFDKDKSRLAIAGKKGVVMLTIKQAETLKDELSDILELREVITAR